MRKADSWTSLKPVFSPPSDGVMLSEGWLPAQGLPPRPASFIPSHSFLIVKGRSESPLTSKGCSRETTELILAQHIVNNKWQLQEMIIILF